MSVHRKRNADAPPGSFACEASGLRWLGSVPGGVPCARVVDVDETTLTIESLTTASPTRAAAVEFGGRLAVTHAAGAVAFGAPPDDWSGPGYFGPSARPLPMAFGAYERWGEFYAEARLRPALDAAEALPASVAHGVRDVIARCRSGDFDDGEAPARLHGDLWSGNVMWTPRGVVLIDPAAHGGHRESDLAMLALFGCPHLDDVMSGYQARQPLGKGWQDRRGLHQLYPLLMHVALFGHTYASSVAEVTSSALRIGRRG